jgi:hypothetical protein
MPCEKSILRYPTNPFQVAVKPLLCSAALGPLKYSSNTAAIGFAEEGISRKTATSKGGIRLSICLVFVKKTSTVTAAGVWVGVGEEVRVALGLGVMVGVFDDVAVREGVAVAVGVCEGEAVAVGVREGVGEAVFVGIREGVTVAVGSGDLVDVTEGAGEAVRVAVGRGVVVLVADGVQVKVGTMVFVGVGDDV